jgi:hypothetical protein
MAASRYEGRKKKFDDLLGKLLAAKPEPRKKIKTSGRRTTSRYFRSRENERPDSMRRLSSGMADPNS